MSDREFTIEVYIDEYGNWIYGCPEYDLMGYMDVQTLEEDIVFKRNNKNEGDK